MKLVVGLGNPGTEYNNTHHNLGFMVLDKFAKKNNIAITNKKFQSLIKEITLNQEKVILQKPQTYMNLSGQAVARVLKFYKIALSDLMVIYDDLDLEPGKVRYRQKGSSGGHNGIKSLIESLGSKEFERIKIGIGKPAHKNNIEKYVLRKIKDPQIIESVDIALEKLERWLSLT